MNFQSKAAAWAIAALLGVTGTCQAQQSSDSRLNREQNEVLRKSERLRELMTQLLKRYRRDGGEEDVVRLLEAGIAHLEKSALMDAASSIQSNLDAGALDDAVREQATVIAELEKLLDILLDRQSLESIEEEIAATSRMIAEAGELLQRQRDLRQEARQARTDEASAAERQLDQTLSQLAQEQRAEATANEQQAGSQRPVLELSLIHI